MLKIYLYSFLLIANIAFAQSSERNVITPTLISSNQATRTPITSITNGNKNLIKGARQTYKRRLTPEQIQKNEISIYPNPTTGAFKLRTSSLNANYKLYNVLGQRVQIKGTLIAGITKLIDLSNLKDGVYLLKVNLDKDTFKTYKIVKKK